MAWGQPTNETVVLDYENMDRSDPRWIAKRDELISKHETSKDVLARAKETEMEDRVALTKFLFPKPTVGTQRVPLNNGYAMKLVHKENHKITKSNDEVDAAEDAARAVGNEGGFLFERIITWEPKFSLSEYKKLDTDLDTHKSVKKIVDGLIEVTEAAPSLTLEEPKKGLRN